MDTIYLNGADLAEKYLADLDYEPGTVLVFSGPTELSVTGQVGCTRVAGVVATNPAYVMNSALTGPNVVVLTLVGRTMCKCLGPVTKGDLLVTSEIAGYAKVDNDAKAGTIIGKAIESWNEGKGGLVEICVGRF